MSPDTRGAGTSPRVGLAREVITTATNERVMQSSMKWALKDVR